MINWQIIIFLGNFACDYSRSSIYHTNQFHPQSPLARSKCGDRRGSNCGQRHQPPHRLFLLARADAWQQLKDELEAKHWIAEGDRINVLNQATEVINFWQDLKNQSKQISMAEAQSKFPDVVFSGSN